MKYGTDIRKTCRLLFVFACFAAIIPAAGFAHWKDMQDANRIVNIRLDDSTLTVDNTIQFREMPALDERLRADRDADNTISREEALSAAEHMRGRVSRATTLLLNSHQLKFDSSDVARVDPHGTPQIVPLHLDYEFSFTAQTADYGEEYEIVYRDTLGWAFPGTTAVALTLPGNLELVESSLPGETVSSRKELKDCRFIVRQVEVSEKSQASQWRIAAYSYSVNLPGEGDSPFASDSLSAFNAAEKMTVNRDNHSGHVGFNELVSDYFIDGETGRTALWLLILAAFAYGCVHALAPGHAKTLTAAYLLGGPGGYFRALVLAAGVTISHTGSVLILAVITKLAYGNSVEHGFQAVVSLIAGAAVVVFGLFRLKGRGEHTHADDHEHPHDHEHTHDHEHPHTHELGHKHENGTLSAFVLGFLGGLMPCPGALWVYLLSLGVGKPGLGIVLLVALSFGLALTLALVGLASIWFGRKIDNLGHGRRRMFRWLTAYLPQIGGVVLILAGAFLMFKGLQDLGLIF